MIDLIDKFNDEEHFELALKCIYTSMEDFVFFNLKEYIQFQNVAFYSHTSNQFLLKGKKVVLNEQTKEERFYKVCQICYQEKIQFCFFNEIPYRILYPILSVVLKENQDYSQVIYPNVPIIAHLKDIKAQNRLTKVSNSMNAPLQLIYKKDYKNNDFVEFLTQNILKRINDC